MSRPIETLLVANRGEIAVRIFRTARSLGIKTVAIASEPDSDAPHAKAADRCLVIGPGPAAQSYLDQDKVLAAAKSAGADAIHPGYGFLSENAAFAHRVVEEGFLFVGPPADAIAAMGDKATSKQLMPEAGVPCIPGYEGESQDEAIFAQEAQRIGYPVMVKASAGGGGKGMRIVQHPDDLSEAVARARSEAETSFGNGRLLIEKAMTEARHVEVQVFADQSGHTVHLGERDCSLQRRHQKVIEEAPSPAVSADLRERMGRAAIEAAKAVNYVGAGTVEFLLAADGAFYFLEMNTRLQVEHPVTEEITGLDLVALQIRVAQGLPLGFEQSDLRLSGHAIEARLYAEAPEDGFLPQAGHVKLWKAPHTARADAGIETGGMVSPHYDPMLAKIIAYGSTRDEARRRLITALEESALLGVRTNRSFLLDLLKGEAFSKGDALTTTIDNSDPPVASQPDNETVCLGAVLLHLDRRDEALNSARAIASPLLGWQGGANLPSPYGLVVAGDIVRTTVTAQGSGFAVVVGDQSHHVEISERTPRSVRATINAAPITASYLCDGTDVLLSTANGTFTLTDDYQRQARAEDAEGSGRISAPMHGIMTEVVVEVGQIVAKDEKLAILEAMKMQHELTAPVAGTVTEITATAGTQIGAGDTLIVIEPKEET
ncbi:MAG: biotin carboxylase N-terminal domain-containing protein [Pseudomonadota bacterium]